MKILGQLFFSFFKTGLFTFGGGYAMLPLLKEELVVKRKWITEDELLNYFSIGQCTPGIIAINVSTFCGHKLKKSIGAIVATLATVLPSLIIIILIASVLKEVMDHPVVSHVFHGIRIGVVAILLKVVYDMGVKVYQTNSNKILPLFIFFAAFLALVFFKISAVFVVLSTLIFAFILMISKRSIK